MFGLKPPGQGQPTTNPGSAQSIPGKQPQISPEIAMPPSVVTGDKLVDEGLACQRAPAGSVCFLSDDQRSQLVQDGQARYNAAETHYANASRIVSAQIAEMLRAEADKVPAWVMLLLDVAGVGAMRALDLAKEHAVEFGTSLLGESGMSPTTIEDLARVSAKQLDLGIEVSVGMAKDEAKEALGEDAKQGAERHAKSTGAAYEAMLAQLDHQTELIFRALREDAPAEAHGDAELILWFVAADPRRGGMTEAFFMQLLEAKASRFKLSAAATAGDDTERLGVLHATRVQWRRDPASGERRLALVQADVASTCDHVDLRSARFIRWIPDEFEATAVEIQEARGYEVTEEGEDHDASCPIDDSVAAGAVPL